MMRLHEFFNERAANGQPLVLVTVTETEGSTYSKAGGQMIIDGEGQFCGMLSGGCLEGDLVERARQVIATGQSKTARYDLGADDELWGLGVGCDGTIHLLLQPLSANTHYEPFASIAETLDGSETAVLAMVIESESSAINAGDSAFLTDRGVRCFGLTEADASLLADAAVFSGPARAKELDTGQGRCRALFVRITPSPSLLILGAGPDSEPVVRIASELGWRCTVSDHRPAYIENRSYPGPTDSLCSAVDDLSGQMNLNRFDMAIVMSHHLASDRSYLRQLAASNVGYIGLLGPPARRDRLIDELGEQADALRDRLHGPAGMKLGGRGAGPIALEIVAEMQQFLTQRG